MSTLAVISNARSRHNRKGGLQAAQTICEENNIPHETLDPAHNAGQNIDDALKKIAQHNPEILVINGGDGTVDMVLTAIIRDNPFNTTPAFALIKGGTTNMTHGDIGLSPAPEVALKKLCGGWRPKAIPHNPLLVTHTGMPVLCGFFLGVNAIPRAIKTTRKHYHKKGLTGTVGQFLSILGILFGWESSKILAPIPLRWASDDEDEQNSAVSLLYVTSLTKLILNVRPTKSKSGKLNLFVADNRINKRSDIIKGICTNKDLPGITRKSVETIRLTGEFEWTLDGEFHKTTDKNDSLTITLGSAFSFLTDRAS